MASPEQTRSPQQGAGGSRNSSGVKGLLAMFENSAPSPSATSPGSVPREVSPPGKLSKIKTQFVAIPNQGQGIGLHRVPSVKEGINSENGLMDADNALEKARLERQQQEGVAGSSVASSAGKAVEARGEPEADPETPKLSPTEEKPVAALKSPFSSPAKTRKDVVEKKPKTEAASKPAKVDTAAANKKKTTPPQVSPINVRKPRDPAPRKTTTTAAAKPSAKATSREQSKTRATSTTRAASKPREKSTTRKTSGTAPAAQPFKKPAPKEATRPANLKGSAFAPTAAYLAKQAKDAEAKAAQTASRRPPSAGAAHQPKAKQPVKAKAPVRPKSSSAHHQPENRAPPKPAPSGDFLSRMMRPTAASSKKTHDKKDADKKDALKMPPPSKKPAPAAAKSAGASPTSPKFPRDAKKTATKPEPRKVASREAKKDVKPEAKKAVKKEEPKETKKVELEKKEPAPVELPVGISAPQAEVKDEAKEEIKEEPKAEVKEEPIEPAVEAPKEEPKAEEPDKTEIPTEVPTDIPTQATIKPEQTKEELPTPEPVAKSPEPTIETQPSEKVKEVSEDVAATILTEEHAINGDKVETEGKKEDEIVV